MKLYPDAANRAAAEPLLATGLFSGVLTNPTILRRASKEVADILEVYRWANVGAKEVFLQAWRADSAVLVDCGLRLRQLVLDELTAEAAKTFDRAVAASSTSPQRSSR